MTAWPIYSLYKCVKTVRIIWSVAVINYWPVTMMLLMMRAVSWWGGTWGQRKKQSSLFAYTLPPLDFAYSPNGLQLIIESVECKWCLTQLHEKQCDYQLPPCAVPLCYLIRSICFRTTWVVARYSCRPQRGAAVWAVWINSRSFRLIVMRLKLAIVAITNSNRCVHNYFDFVVIHDRTWLRWEW